MENQNKYYAPEIEDIRVGYECQLFWNQDMLPEDDWYDAIVRDSLTEDWDFIDWIGKIANSKVRVPYLTKEQIEEEGWKYDLTPLESIHFFNKGTYKLTLFPEQYIIINDNNNPDIVYYHGHCPSINELRYICKLLKIK